MSLELRIKIEMKDAMKAGDAFKRDTLRLVISEIDRKEDRNVELTDEEVQAIITKMVKSERETCALLAKREGRLVIEESDFCTLLETYLPTKATYEEIESWILENLPEVKEVEGNGRMRFMKNIMAHFGKNADGNTVKEVLMKV